MSMLIMWAAGLVTGIVAAAVAGFIEGDNGLVKEIALALIAGIFGVGVSYIFGANQDDKNKRLMLMAEAKKEE